jgi:hypothetical protein
MKKKKTAIEWLVEQLARKQNEFQALTFYYDYKEEIEQAKQMEKDQITKAYNSAIPFKFGEEYYKKTYGK